MHSSLTEAPTRAALREDLERRPAERGAPPTRPRPGAAGALLLYAALALLFWGPWLVSDPSRFILAANDIDPSAYLWFFSWWPHALLHGMNPFEPGVIFAPEGYNLAWVASMPGPSLLLAPVTLTLGPAVSWNLITLASPALSAWTAFLLCRRITGGAPGPSLAGGYIFGFSPYMLGHLIGAPQLTFVALIPLMALLALRHAEGSIGDLPFVVGLAAALAGEFLISTEVLATVVVFGVVALTLAYAILADRRPALRRTAGLAAVAGAIAAALVAPVLYYVFAKTHTRPEHALDPHPADVLSLVVPSHWSGIATSHTPGGVPLWATGFAYFSVPLLLLIALFAWRHRASRAARLAVSAFAVAAVASLGSTLVVAEHDTGIPLPWALAAELPLLQYAIPVRLSVFAFLAAGVIVALWLAWRPSVARWLLVGLAVAFLAPAVGNASWHTELSDRPFFSQGLHASHLRASDRVLMIPAWGSNMRWQAEAGFSFSVVGGYVGAFPQAYSRYPIWGALLGGPLPPHPARELRRLLRDKGATAIVVDPGQEGRWRPIVEALGHRPLRAGGVLLYRLRP